MYADVIIDITHEKLDKIFQYRVPKELEGTLETGMEVVVPFGKGDHERHGYIVGFSDTCDCEESRIKDVKGPAEGSVAIESRLVQLASWMKEHYGGTMIQALRTVLPVKRQEREKEQRNLQLLLPREAAEKQRDTYLRKSQKARARLLSALLETADGVLPWEQVSREQKVPLSVARALEAQGVAELVSSQVYRNPVGEKEKEETPIVLTGEQEAALRTFREDYRQGKRGTYLLWGVTGSGKTEVYMAMIQEAVARGRQAIVLIPEIALTYQTVRRFQNRFGNRVSIMNSRLSAGERYDQMMRAKRGELDVMIGPRSALFTPFPALGLIVIDEEHETAYKSGQVPRYHARETAEHRAALEGASLVLGSATPSLEAFSRCQEGQYRLLTLQNRIDGRTLPRVETVDMRRELKEGNRSIFSRSLREQMEESLAKGEQVMLFLNRRGYAGFLSCRSCGYVVKCPHCDVSLSLHRDGKMRCHYCGYETAKPKQCPSCGSPHIGGFRAGTQQIEELVRREFPEAGVLRMDMDTTRNKGGHEKILAAFARGEAQILVGTQMIVKGHDFPGVTLVGILAADISLYADDYRAAERTFQLLTQAAGRAGRGRKEGRVVIQTYTPDHYSIRAAAAQDYLAFYREEMEYRELMGYPPAAHLLAVLAASRDEALLEKGMYYLKQIALRIAKKNGLQVIGPATPAVGKVRDTYRKVLYLKQEDYACLTEAKNRMEEYIELNRGYQDIWIQFDFDPVTGL